MFCFARLSKQTLRHFRRNITSRELRKDFGVIFDIDGINSKNDLHIGVMMKGENVIPGAASTVEQIPFLFVTNGGGMTESVKAKYLSEKLRVPINENQILLSHTPYKSLIQRYKDCRILVIGAKDSLNVAKSYGFYKAIDTTGYIQEHPRLHAFKTYQSKNSQYCKEPISTIMIYADSYDWYPDLQVCMDLLTAGRISSHGFGQAIPIYQSNDDLLFSTNYAYPRLAGGAFGRCLKEIFKSLTGSELNIITYGKPSRHTYNYAEKMLNDLSSIPLKRFYGIGDNPNSDIKGANKAGKQWTSILVRTGIFNGEGNDPVNPAKYVVNNVHDAVQQIFKVESVSSPIRH